MLIEKRIEKTKSKINGTLDKYNIKWNMVIRGIVYIICSGIMFYQVRESCQEYYKYNTVVQIKIAKPVTTELPAVTVCRQMKVKEFLKMVIQNDPDFGRSISKSSKDSNIQNSPTDNSVEEPETQNQTEEQEEHEEWVALDKLAKFYRDQPERDSQKLFEYIKPSLIVNCYDVRNRADDPPSCEYVAHPINSFTQRRICVTYFSKLYINLNFSLDKLNVSDNFTGKSEDQESLFAWFMIENPQNDTFIYIHTSKSMPDINLYELEMTRSRIIKEKTYGIIFQKHSVTRLEYPYATNCENYREERRTESDPLSEFSCIGLCKKRFWRNNPDLNCTPVDLIYIFEAEDQYSKICNCTVKPCDKTLSNCELCKGADSEEYKKYSKECEDKCLQDCYEEYYQKDMFELRDDFKAKIWQKYNIKNQTENETLVFIASKYHEEFSYTHNPKTSQFDFFAMLGGLFSLWIGASVLTIYDVLHILVKCGQSFYETYRNRQGRLAINNRIMIPNNFRQRHRENVYDPPNHARIRKHINLPGLSNFY